MKIKPGDSVRHKDYGAGVCVKVDSRSKFMRYFLKFQDGTVVWLPESKVKEIERGDFQNEV